MKLRPFPVSLNGNILAADQFGFRVGADGKPTHLEFACRGKPARPRQCQISIRLGEPEANMHGWDGNETEPTIKPSIGCDSRCGWHGHIINGEITP
jgi:hypothetical protein